ncbi:unnamed protein product [Rotaria magnacalcarata]|uniref:Transposase n=1 Tax=Rotaria magnacalcarata TaxID=392030 RepID=A0A816LB49_9BILA|nr:unnamed protein product [Rotaria magnacalcarata]
MATALEVTEVPPYVSAEEEDTNDSVQVECKRAKKKQHKWMKEMVFNNAGEAKQAVINEGVWSEYYTNTTADGKKRLLGATKLNVGENSVMPVFICCLKKCTRIPYDVKVIIKEFYELKFKPKAILKALYERGIVTPSISQLNNFFGTLKTKRFGSTSINLDKIEQWCMESSRSILVSDDEGFVVSYDEGFVVSYEIVNDGDDDGRVNDDDDDDDDGNKFRTTDLDRQFHSVGIAVCSDEKTKDFTFVFRALQHGVKKLNLQEINPDVLIANGSGAILNGFQAIFGEKPIVMCWAHMRRNAVKKIESMDENTFRERLPLSRFKVLTFEIVEKWPKSYERGLKQFHDKQTMTLDIRTDSCQWVKLNKSIASTKLENEIEFCVPAEKELSISKNEIDVMKKIKWYSFD